MKRKEVLEWPPAYPPQIRLRTAPGKGRRYLAVSQLIMSDGHDVLEVDIWDRQTGEMLLRYFADRQARTFLAWIRKTGEVRRLALENAVSVARGGLPDQKKTFGEYSTRWWGDGNCRHDWPDKEDELRAMDYLGCRIEDFETDIEHGKHMRAQERKKERIRKIMEEIVPELPEDFEDWIKAKVFDREYCFIEEKPKTFRCTCSACGHSGIRRQKPKRISICPSCGAGLTAETEKSKVSRLEPVYLFQKAKNGTGAWVERKFCVRRHWKPDGGDLDIYEEIRVLVGRGQTWGSCYYAISDRNGMTYFWDSNPASLRNAAGYIYDRNIREVAENCWPEALAHRGIDILARQQVRINGNNAVILTSDILEYLIKKGYFTIAQEIINQSKRYRSTLFAREGKTAGEILRLDGGRAERLKQLKGGCITLGWLQYEGRMKGKLSNENLGWLEKHGVGTEDAWKVLEYEQSPEKFTNYLRKQSGIRQQGPHATLTDWKDYLEMAKKQKYNLKASLFVRPKDLKAAHDACVWAGQKKEAQKRRTEILEKYPHAENNLREVKEKYEFSDKKYVIRVPEDITEIIHEGRALGHCIDTTDRYFDRIEHKTSYLMFLRHAESPDTPWYTLEVEPGGTIRQQRTTGNRQNKEDQKAYMPFIRSWQQAVRDRITEEDRKLADQSRTIRIKEYKELREKKETVWHGTLAGKLLADVLEADLVEA